MEEVILECKTVSPMLSRGILPDRSGAYPFEIRPQSIKGVLRFWFRAVAPFFVEPSDFGVMRRLEENVFGSRERISPFTISVELLDERFRKFNEFVREQRQYAPAMSYCAYGTLGEGGGTPYTCLLPDSRFVINFRFPKATSIELKTFLISLTRLVSCYSGFGAKTRKGYGSFQVLRTKTEAKDSEGFKALNLLNERKSVSLHDLRSKAEEQELNPASDLDDCLKRLKNLIALINSCRKQNDTFPESMKQRQDKLSPQPFPSLQCSRETDAFIYENSWQEVLAKLFRLRDRSGKARGLYTSIKLNELRGFRSEKDDFLQIVRNTVMRGNPLPPGLVFKPSILGLPIHYQNVDTNENRTGREVVMLDLAENQKESEKPRIRRKASPLFISVHRSSSGYFARLLLMPSRITESGVAAVTLTYKGQQYGVEANEDFENLWKLFEGGAK